MSVAQAMGTDHAGVLAGGEADAAAPSLTGLAPDVAGFVALGHARVVDFQDAAYGELYLARLRTVGAAERRADPAGAHGGAPVRETARFLALWMAFDDIVRVADLKTRRARFARVAAELSAGAADVVRIIDHFKPGVPEMAGLLPRALATRLLRLDHARRARGREPFAWPLRLRTDTISGYLLLRGLARLRVLRRHGVRYADEQQAIDRWLAATAAGCAADWHLGHEIALCGRLIKGYGATNERGKATLAHILDHLAGGDGLPGARAAAVRAAREAALADGSGASLDATLARHGAPPRPVAAHPVVWHRRPAAPLRTGHR
jgi:indolepyruvate ferredoxin oxidoreductase beta subunit